MILLWDWLLTSMKKAVVYCVVETVVSQKQIMWYNLKYILVIVTDSKESWWGDGEPYEGLYTPHH